MKSVAQFGAVYAISNTQTGHIYIGQSVNAYQRWQQHQSSLKRGRHQNRHLQHAWKHYGAHAFEWGILEHAATAEALDELEAFYISYLRACGAQLYNFRSGGHADRRLVGMPPASPQERARRSAWARTNNIRPSPLAIARARLASLGRQKSQQEIERWREHNDWVGGKRDEEFCRRVSAGTRGKQKTRTPALQAKWEAQRGRKEPPEQTARRIAAQVANRPVYAFRSPDGAVFHTQNISQFARDHGLHPRLLAYVVEGKQRHHRGWTLVH